MCVPLARAGTRGGPQRSTHASRAPVEAAKPLPGAENANKPGYYTVRPGDTLIRIALDSGQNWRDIQRWNTIENPNVIEVGQVLRVIPPAGTEVAVARPVTPGSAVPSSATASAPVSTSAANGNPPRRPVASLPP